MGGRLHGPAATAGGLGTALMIFQPLASLRIDILALTLLLAHAACGSLSASRLRIEFSTAEARSGCEPALGTST